MRRLGEAASVARGGGGLLVVRDAAGRVLWSDRMAGHRGMPGMRMLGDPVAAPVEVAGARVGEAVVRFGGMTTRAGPAGGVGLDRRRRGGRAAGRPRGLLVRDAPAHPPGGLADQRGPCLRLRGPGRGGGRPRSR